MTADMHLLAGAAALDAVEDDERTAFLEHLPSCEICQAEYDDFLETAGRLAVGASRTPPTHLRNSVMAATGSIRQVAPDVPGTVTKLAKAPGRRANARRWALRTLPVAAAAALLLVVLLVANRDDAVPIGDEVAAVRESTDARTVVLEGQEPGSISLSWSAMDARVAVDAEDLAPVASGDTYALWLVDDEGAHLAGSFDPDETGASQAVFDVAREPTGWGITIEPEGDAPVASGEIIYSADA